MFVGVVVAALYTLWFNLVTNAQRLGLDLDLDFLSRSAEIRIAGADFRPSDTVLNAFIVGVKNTLVVSALGIAIALVLGVLIGIARLSANWLVARAAAVYVQTLRNIPLLAIIFFAYFAGVLKFPHIDDAARFGPLELSNRGVLVGPFTLRPEFVALLVALSIYTASHIAEIVRGSIQAVAKGQVEAATALGLRPTQRLRLVVLPQATRIALPQILNQFLNLLKNSSLGLAIAFPDIMGITQVLVGNGRAPAPQAMALDMATYLVISLLIALVVNLYLRRHQWAQR